MSEKSQKILRRIRSILLTLLTLLLGVLLMISALSVYRQGLQNRADAAEEARAEAARLGLDEDAATLMVAQAAADVNIYSREIVGNKFTDLLPVTVVWLICIVAGAVLEGFLPPQKGKKDSTPVYMTAERLSLRMDESTRKARTHRHRRMLGGVIGLMLLLSVTPVLFLRDATHFPGQDLNAEVLAAVLLSLPFVIAMGALAVVYVLWRDRETEKQARDDKAFLRAASGAASVPVSCQRRSGRWVIPARVLLLCIGISLVVIGCVNGSTREVLAKAIKICTECIGLG